MTPSFTDTYRAQSRGGPCRRWNRVGAGHQGSDPGGQAAGLAGLDRCGDVRGLRHADGRWWRRWKPDVDDGQHVRRRPGRQEHLRHDADRFGRPLGRCDALYQSQSHACRGDAGGAGGHAACADAEAGGTRRSRRVRPRHPATTPSSSTSTSVRRARCTCTGAVETRCAPVSRACSTWRPPSLRTSASSSRRVAPPSVVRTAPPGDRCGRTKSTRAWFRPTRRWSGSTRSPDRACRRDSSSRSVRNRT